MKTEISKEQDEQIQDIVLKDKQHNLTGKHILTALNAKDDHKHNSQQSATLQTANIYNSKRTKRELNALITLKDNDISSLSHTQEKYQCELQSLLQKLNDIITVATNQKNNSKPPIQNQEKQLEYLESLRLIRIKDFQKAKSQNKIYKDQYDIFQTKVSGISSDKLTELESKIDTLVEDNQSLTKKVRNLKNKQNVKSKVLEGYSSNVKYPREIKAYTEEIKSLSSKKHDYYIKLNTNRKAISNCLLQMVKIEELYNKLKTKTNLPNPVPVGRIDSEINKINTDLKGNEDDIIQRIDNDEMIIIQEDIKKQQSMATNNNHNNNNILHHPKYLKSIPLRSIKKNPHTSHSANRRIIIQNQEKDKRLSPQSIKALLPSTTNKRGTYSSLHSNINNINTNAYTSNNNPNDIGDGNNNEDKDLSNIIYENITDFEYRELITKKEHYTDIILKLENSIKEAKKMYERKLKEMNNTLDQSSKKLSYFEQENELLKSEIADLSKISKLTEEANQLRKENQRVVIPTIQKEQEVHTINNNDVSETRNDILNDLNVLDNSNEKNQHLLHQHQNMHPTSILEEHDDLEDKEGNSKIRFPDISNVEHIDEDKSTINRDKVLIDIKKKYIKVPPKKKKEEDADEDNDNREDSHIKVDEKEVELIKDIKEDGLKEGEPKDNHSISIEDHFVNKEELNESQKEDKEIQPIDNNNNEANQKEKEDQQDVIQNNPEDKQNIKDIIESNSQDNQTQYPPKTIVRIQQREGKMMNAFENDYSPQVNSLINKQHQGDDIPLKDSLVKNEVLAKENEDINNKEVNPKKQEEIIPKVKERKPATEDKELIIHKQELQFNINQGDNNEGDIDNDENALEEDRQEEQEIKIGNNDDSKLNDIMEDSIDNGEKELNDQDKEMRDKMAMNEGKAINNEEEQIDQLDFNEDNIEQDNKDIILMNKKIDINYQDENDESQNQEKQQEEKKFNQKEENHNQDEKDHNQEEENQDQEEENQDLEEENQKQDEEEEDNEEFEEMENHKDENEEEYKNKLERNNAIDEKNESKQQNDNRLLENNPLSDSLEKSPEKENNTIIDKLKKEKVYNQ